MYIVEIRIKSRIYLILFTVIIFSIIAYLTSLLSFLPESAKGLVYIAIILITGVLIVNLLSDIVELKSNLRNKQASNTVIFVTRLVGYIVVAAVALSSFKIGITSIILGGGFLGVVVGLAAQTSLSNFFSGIVLLFAKPFNIGDRVTLSTWQYGLIAPSYPPKFFSDDFLIPGYTGTVEKMTLAFTTIRLDSNIPIKIPNSIVLQAAIFVNNELYRSVKVRYEVPSSISPDNFMKKAKEELKKITFIKGVPEIFISETNFTNRSNIFSVKALCKSDSSDLPRSEIIKKLIDVNSYFEKKNKK